MMDDYKKLQLLLLLPSPMAKILSSGIRSTFSKCTEQQAYKDTPKNHVPNSRKENEEGVQHPTDECCSTNL
ncbi:hypothetical protein EJB05_32666 [Eragrostis curvula]|uniref:Uncharacterized protein n=1 Tax=Eragrostis curvula TaxID=38414 RepID=A0A5J9UGU1_9POAL|nr:hypothetical protein EJB05_32666 [Eragrostis curvula]